MDIQFIMFIVFYLWLVLSERLMVYHVHVFQISIQVWKLICSGSFTSFAFLVSSGCLCDRMLDYEVQELSQ